MRKSGPAALTLALLCLAAAVCTGVSTVIYFVDGVRQLSASPHSAPSSRP